MMQREALGQVYGRRYLLAQVLDAGSCFGIGKAKVLCVLFQLVRALIARVALLMYLLGHRTFKQYFAYRFHR